MNDRLMFDNGVEENSVVSYDNPLPVEGVSDGVPMTVILDSEDPLVVNIGTTADPAVASGADNTPAATLIAVAKSIANAATSTVPVGVIDTASATGTTTSKHFVTAATINATGQKATPGQLYHCSGLNIAAYPIYIKFYDKASAPAPGTDVPILVVGVPAGAAFDRNFGKGFPFPTSGIAYAVVKGIGDTDATAVAAGDATVSMLYV